MGEMMATQVISTTQLSDQKLSEQKLIRAGQRGDSAAIEALFRRYQRQLFQTALRVLGNADSTSATYREIVTNRLFMGSLPRCSQIPLNI